MIEMLRTIDLPGKFWECVIPLLRIGKLILMVLFPLIPFSCTAQSDESVILEYIEDLRSTKSIDSVIYKYYPSAPGDDEFYSIIKEQEENKRTYLNENPGIKIEIKRVKKSDDYLFMQGLKWQEGIYLVLVGDQSLKLLIKNKRIVSTSIMTKGKMKFFLKM